MARLCFTLDLVNDARLIEAYERHHEPGNVWNDIVEDIRQEGFLEMQIWRCDDRLFMVAETAEDFPRGKRGPLMTEIHERWQAAMDRYQVRLPDTPAGVKWKELHIVFDLAEHSGNADPASPARRVFPTAIAPRPDGDTG